MEGRVEKSNNHLPGVKCVVSTCYYHAQDDHCQASTIEIAPRDAKTTHETDCNTYSPHKGTF